MSNLNDAYLDVLSNYSGSVDDRRKAYLMDYLNYVNTTSLNDLEWDVLQKLGYKNSLTDAWLDHLKSLGGMTLSDKGSLLSSTFYGSSPSRLFLNNEVGTWYDPSDLTTLFQDSAGTTPVTAAGQPVGLMLDKSKGLALGAELITNGDFSNGATGWILTPSSGGSDTPSLGVVTAGALVVTGAGTPRVAAATSPEAGTTFVVGKTYRITAQISAATSSPFLAVAGGADMTSLLRQESPSNTARQAQLIWTATQANAFIGIRSSTSGTFTVDNVSVKLLAGNHATQATSAQRPTYGIHPYSGVRNLQVQTENFSSSSWTKNACTVSVPSVPAPARGGAYGRVTSAGTFSGLKSPFVFNPLTQYTVSGVVKKVSGSIFSLVGDNFTPLPKIELNFDTGAISVANCTGTATLVGANEYFVTMTFTTPAVTTNGRIIWWVGVYSGDNTAGQAFDLSAPQIELGATATAYQKVVTQYEVTEAGVTSVHYIGFDGVDDGMVTSAIDFSATDAVTVFAGVRKLSDEARGVLFETTTGTDKIAINAPNGPTPAYTFFSSAAQAAYNNSAVAAPVTNVVTGIGSIPDDISNLRINGVLVASDPTDQGTGFYGSSPLYIGSRSGTSLYFNGNIYSLIVRGAQSNTNQITNVENWINSHTGAY